MAEDVSDLLAQTSAYAAQYVADLSKRDMSITASVDELRDRLGGPLPVRGTAAVQVLRDLIAGAEGGISGTPSGRFFGFVIGGVLPASLAADWLTSTWDQNAGLYAAGPAASVVEEVAGAWLKELLGLPDSASYAFVTGCTMAHMTGLAAARLGVLDRAGWDLNARGLAGSPPIRVVVGAERHVTLDVALRYVGIGTDQLVVLPADAQGRMDVTDLPAVLASGDAPTIVCAQSGNVNSGAFDDLNAIADAAQAVGAWLHVDGAFGMWAAAAPSLRHLVAGVERCDSWATDGHKWLNVPYDSGFAFVAQPAPHRQAMSVQAPYLMQSGEGGPRDEMDWTPEFSRRARGFTAYAAIRALGRDGIAAMVEQSCAHARHFAELLDGHHGARVVNDVVLNQVLVTFGDDAHTDAVVKRVQESGVCWLGGSKWHGQSVMRISVSNWSTTTEDVERSADAILAAARS